MHISVNGDYIDTDVKVGVAVLKFLAVECQMFPAILFRLNEITISFKRNVISLKRNNYFVKTK